MICIQDVAPQFTSLLRSSQLNYEERNHIPNNRNYSTYINMQIYVQSVFLKIIWKTWRNNFSYFSNKNRTFIHTTKYTEGKIHISHKDFPLEKLDMILAITVTVSII